MEIFPNQMFVVIHHLILLHMHKWCQFNWSVNCNSVLPSVAALTCTKLSQRLLQFMWATFLFKLTTELIASKWILRISSCILTIKLFWGDSTWLSANRCNHSWIARISFVHGIVMSSYIEYIVDRRVQNEVVEHCQFTSWVLKLESPFSIISASARTLLGLATVLQKWWILWKRSKNFEAFMYVQ